MANIIIKTSKNRNRRGLVYHMEYNNGKSRTIQGRSATECTDEGIRQAERDGYDFRSGKDIKIWQKK
jgi:hypothetical protein